MYCKNCGARLDDGALFCRKCGTSATDESKQPMPGPGLAAPEPDRQGAPNPFVDVPQRKPNRTHRIKKRETTGEKPENANARSDAKNRRLLLLICLAALAAVAATVVIVSVASCKKSEQTKASATLEDVQNAVLDALERGDGEALASLAKLSEPLLGAHPEEFGEGDTPEAVMRGYYDRLAGDFYANISEWYGEGFRLSAELLTEYYADTRIFEENRALGIDGSQYAVLSGPIYVGDDEVGTLRIVAVELNGEWKLLVVDLY